MSAESWVALKAVVTVVDWAGMLAEKMAVQLVAKTVEMRVVWSAEMRAVQMETNLVAYLVDMWAAN